MADDKDKKLKELEEEIKKVKETLTTPPRPEEEEPVPPVSRAQWNPELLRLRAGEGNKFEPTVSDASARNVYLPEGSNKEKIIAEARNGKGKKTPGEKAANKIKRLAKQAAQKKKEAAAKKAASDNLATESAREAKRDTEYERSVRERHDKDKPSAWEMAIADLSGGLLGGVMGTYDRYMDASRAANDEIETFRRRNKLDDTMRKSVANARLSRAAGTVAPPEWTNARQLATSNAYQTIFSNAYNKLLFRNGNPLVRIGTNTAKDTPEQVQEWLDKSIKKAAKGKRGSPEAIRQLSQVASRIAAKEESLKPFVKKDLVIRDNRGRHEAALIASIPAHYGITTSQGQSDYVNSFENIMHLEDKLLGQIDANNAISSYFDAMQSLADNGGDKYSKLKQAIQVELDLGVESKALKNIASMKEWMSGYENELTSIEKNLSVIKNAENAVVKLKAEAAGLRGRGKDKEADEVDKQAAEAQRQLETILALSSHSDLRLRVGKDGRTETFVDGTNVKLITQRFTPDGRSVADVNYEGIDSLYRSGKITESEMKALIQDANETVAGIESNWRLSGGPATSPKSEGAAMGELEYNAWVDSKPEEFAIVQEGVKIVVEHIIAEERKGNTAAYAEAKLGVGLNKRQKQIMRSRYAKHMLLLWKVADDEAKAAAKKKSDEGKKK